jgi:hypothetical protein
VIGLRCQVEVSATSRSLVQMSPTECCVSVCHHKDSMTRSPRPSRDVEQWGRGWEVNKFLFACVVKLMNCSSDGVHEPSACGRVPQYHLKMKHEVLGTFTGAVFRLQGSGNVTTPFCYPVT